MKKHLKKLTELNFIVPVLVVAVLVQTVLIAYLWQKTDDTWFSLSGSTQYPPKQNNDDVVLAGVAGLPIKVYINNAVKGVFSLSTVTDINSNIVYVPEAKISLPMNQLSRSLKYSYSEAEGKGIFPETVSFNTSTNLEHLVTKFSDVPCVQRIAGFSINKKDGSSIGNKYGGKVELADGRTLHIWLNENKQCKDFWADSLQNDLVNLIKKAKSY